MIYCYSNDDETKVVERKYRMGEAPQEITVDGEKFYRDFVLEAKSTANPRAWPMLSTAMGCASNQKAAMEEACAQAGVPTEFVPDPEGFGYCAKVMSRKHRKELMKVMRAYDKDGGYGDG